MMERIRHTRFRAFLITAVLSMLIIDDANAEIPSSITPCRRGDPAFKECILSEAKKFYPIFVKGIPELDIPVMDPFFSGDDEYKTPGGFTAKGKDTVLVGFKDAILENIKFDFKRQRLIWKAVGNFTISNRFEMNGRLLAFPLNVKGKLKMEIDTFKMKLVHDLKTVKGADGKNYFHIKHTNKEVDFGNVHFDLNGFLNKEIDATMNALMNNNWREVIQEIGGPAIDIVFNKIIAVLNTFLSKIPEDQLFTE